MIKFFIVFLVFVHGAIHLMGFGKAYGYGNFSQLTQSISRRMGLVWLITFAIFILSGLMLFFNKDLWWIPGAGACILSILLIISAWKDAKFGMIANIIILLFVVIGYGTWHFHKLYFDEVKQELNSEKDPGELLTESSIANLPEPVKKYIRLSGSLNKPKVKNFRIEFSGQIRKKGGEWMELNSEQYNFLNSSKRLFFMEAEMKSLPVAAFHRFDNGNASMDVRLFSLFTVQYQKGDKMGISETVTFFNDMCCMAPATLIDERIKWISTEGNRVQASFTNNGITISATLFFDDAGKLVNFITNDRYALMDNGTLNKMEWSTPLTEYKEFNGVNINTFAQTIYNYPDGNFVYGEFRLKAISYNEK